LDLRYKKLLTVSEESLDQAKKIFDMQNKYFLRFMSAVSMRRMTGGSLQERNGWNKYVNMIKQEMLVHSKKKLINKMIESLPTTGEG
jgi:hypothetical protein